MTGVKFAGRESISSSNFGGGRRARWSQGSAGTSRDGEEVWGSTLPAGWGQVTARRCRALWLAGRVNVYGLSRRYHCFARWRSLAAPLCVLSSGYRFRRLACRDTCDPTGPSSTLLRITALRCARRTRVSRLQPAMSNTIYLSSSPAVATRGSPAIGRLSSPEFPTLEELVTQEPRPASQSLTRNTLSRTVESGWRGNLGKGRAAVANKEQPCAEDDADNTADASLVEIDPVDFAAVPRGDAQSKKAPADGKAPRTRSSGTKKAAQNSTADAPTEDATTETSDPKPPKPRRKQTGAVSRHFKAQSEPARSRQPVETAEKPEEPLNIETALSRRGAWTPPPKDTVREFGSRSSDIIELLSSTSKSPGTDRPRDIFQSLKETYGYELEDDLCLTPEPGDAQAVFKKRKLIEMVSTNGANVMAPPPLPAAFPPKAKAPKKKARTITGLATEAYALEESGLPPPEPADPSAAGPVTEPARPKAKRTTKRKPKAPKKEDPRMVLYSPEAAMKQVAQQDFVFGTSSQLVREQDRAAEPELPRLRDSMSVIEEEYVTPINSDAIEPPEVQPKLWIAGARDAEGELLHLEVVDLVEDSPGGQVVSDDSNPFGYVNPERASQRPSTGVSSRPGASSSVSKTTSSTLGTAPSLKATSQSVSKQPSPPAIVHDPLLGPMSSTSPPPSSQKRLSSIYETNPAHPVPLPSAQIESPTRAPGYTALEKPRFELYTDAQLARQVAAYGFKPVKKRAGMVSLLDECWTSKYQRGPGAGVRAYSTGSAAVAEGDVGEAPEPAAQAVVEPVKRPRGRPRKNSPVSGTALATESTASEPVPAKRPRGRPRKAAAAPAVAPKKPAPAKPAPSTPRKKAPVLEIPDTDSAPSSPEPIFSSPDPHDVSLPTDDSLALAPTTEEATLHAYITKAVTTAPRSGDPGEPSWWERMLMYESVIVEDLAAWLNTGGLDGVGFDGEVSAGEVKGWCEAKSVCCVWRTRVGGAERKRL